MRPLRVLHIEDSEDDSLLIHRELRNAGYELVLDRIQTEAEMRARLALAEWDVIISDYAVPGFGGFEALSVVSELDLDIPFIIISGTIDQETAVRGMRLGASDYLMKGELARLGPAVTRELQEAAIRAEKRDTEKALRQSEQRLKLALHAARMGAWELDLKTNELFWSPETANILGVTIAAIRSNDIVYSGVIEEDREFVRRKYHEAIETRLPVTMRFRVRRRGGEIIWLSESAQCEYDEAGTPLRLVGTVRDITNDKLAEDALMEAEERYRVMAESASDAVISIDGNSTILYANPSAQRMFGYEPYELLGQSLTILMPDALKEAHRTSIEHFIETGERRLDWSRIEAPAVKKDGSKIEVQISFGHHTKDKRDYFTGYVRDVTAAKAAEKAVRRSEQNFRALLEATTQYVWQLDEGGNVTEYPRWWEELTGQGYEESRNYGWVERVHPDDQARVKACYQKAIESGEGVKLELRIQTQQGDFRHYEASGVPLPTDHGTRWICSLADITAQRLAEERYRIVSTAASDYMFSAVVGPNGELGLDWVAGAFESITGYDAESFRKAGGWPNIVYPEDRHIDRQVFEKLKRNEKSECEHRIIKRSGEIVWVRIFAHPVWSLSEDRLVGIWGAVKDITEKKLAEITTKESEQRLQTILDAEPECVKVMDREGHIVDINRAGVRILGANSAAEVLGKGPEHLLVPKLADRFREAVERAWNGESAQLTYELAGLSGKSRWLDMNAVPLRDGSGEVRSVLGVSRDVTDKYLAEDQLRRSEQRYADLINTVEGIVWEVDLKSFCFTFVSQQAEAILGYKTEEWLAPGFWEDHIHPEDREWALAFCSTQTEKGEPHTFEYRMIAADGRTVWLRDLVAVVKEKGKAKMLRGLMVDVTEQRLKDAVNQRQALIIEQANEAIFVWDMEEGIQEWNRGCEKLYGYRREEVLGRFGFDLLKSTIPFAREEFLEYLKVNRSWNGDISQTTKDGRTVYANTTYQVMDFDGRLIVLQTNRDVTEQYQAQQKLQRSEIRYRHLFQNNPYPMFVYDVGTLRFLAVNEAAVDRYGYSKEEFLTKTVDQIRPAADREKALAKMRSDLKQLEYAGIWRHSRKDGSIMNVEIVSHATDWEGKPARLVLAHDVSDRLKAEEALKRSEAKYRELFENANDVIYTHDLEGNFTSLNRTGERITGYTEDEARMMNIREVVAPEHLETAREMIRHKLEGAPPTVYEAEIIGKDGRRIPLEINTRLILENGQPVAVQGIGRDITERKEAEEQIRRHREQLVRTAEASPVVIYSFLLAETGERHFPFASPASLAVFGYSPEALAQDAMPVFERMHPDDRPLMEKAMRVSAETLAPAHETFRYEHPELGSTWIEVHTTPTREPRLGVVWHGIAADVTERINARQALDKSKEELRQAQKLESIGILAGGMAHDFNNMLTAINGYSDLILRKIGPADPIRRNIEEIKKAGERSAQLTSQLLAFSRRQILQPKVINVNETVEETFSLLRRLIGEDIEFVRKLQPDLWKVEADAGQLAQILMNLAVNARDAMPDGGTLMLETSNVELDEEYASKHIDVAAGRFVMLAVTDTGVGMDEKTRRRIFEPFFTTKAIGRGTGLGLSTVYGVVKQSGGNIWVYSEPGQGTTFKIYLPKAKHFESETDLEISQNDLQLGSETILLAEDEQSVRALAREILESCGYVVHEAADGVEALEKLGSIPQPVDLLITDVIMPNMGGRELSQKVREISPDTRVLFTSGYTDDAVLRHGISDEGKNFLQKPFTFASLSKKVRSLLDN